MDELLERFRFEDAGLLLFRMGKGGGWGRWVGNIGSGLLIVIVINF